MYSWKLCDQDDLPQSNVSLMIGSLGVLLPALFAPSCLMWASINSAYTNHYVSWILCNKIVDPKMPSPPFIIRIKTCLIFHCIFNFKCCFSFFSLDLWQRVALLCHQCGVSCGYIIHGWSNIWTIPGDQRLAHSSISHSHATYGRRMLAR